jgi:beta-glucosidase
VLPAGVTALTDASSNAGVVDTGDLAPFPVDYSEGSNVGYRWYAARGDRPLYPFGYGLSYTRFRFGTARFTGGAAPAVEVAVTNTGKRPGVVVPQLYLTGTGQGPLRLAGFQRVELAPGETKQVAISVDPRILARWTAGRGWAVVPGRYRLTLATDAQSLVANGEVSVAAGAQSPG